MKKVFLILLLSFSFVPQVFAQEESTTEYEGFPDEQAPTADNPTSDVVIGLSTIQWNDNLKLQQGITIVQDYANYSGLSLTVQKEKNYAFWGWSAGAFLGAGQAVGGGNSSTLDYKKNKLAFIVYGVSPRVFYRMTGRLSPGVTLMAFMKNIDWPTTITGPRVDAGRNLNLTALMDLNVRLFPQWDFYTAMGPLSEGATFWKIGANYHF